jgi:ABC-type antimicrobial peptide transport system permease subunit
VRFDQVVGKTVATTAGDRVVVGVVDDIKPLPGVAAAPALMVPLTATDAPISVSSIIMAVRTAPGLALDRAALDRRLDEVLGSNAMPVKVIADLLPPFLQQPRFQAALFGAVAVIGLIVAAVGLYAVAAFDVARRRFELSVRMSLGATSADLQRLVIRNALKPVLLGTAAGSMTAWWLATSLQEFLLEVDARDPWTVILVAGVLIATAIAAAWFPARRAGASDPSAVLRAG